MSYIFVLKLNVRKLLWSPKKKENKKQSTFNRNDTIDCLYPIFFFEVRWKCSFFFFFIVIIFFSFDRMNQIDPWIHEYFFLIWFDGDNNQPVKLSFIHSFYLDHKDEDKTWFFFVCVCVREYRYYRELCIGKKITFPSYFYHVKHLNTILVLSFDLTFKYYYHPSMAINLFVFYTVRQQRQMETMESKNKKFKSSPHVKH